MLKYLPYIFQDHWEPGTFSEEIIEQVKKAGMKIIEKITINEISGTEEQYETDFKNIELRCMELAEKYSEKKNYFKLY